MRRNWKQQLRNKPSVVKLQEYLRARGKLLKDDKEFILERERVTRALEKAYEKNPERVSEFLRRFTDPTAIRDPQVSRLLRRTRNKQVRSALWQYMSFVFRFRVLLARKRKAPHFRPVYLPEASLFHVKLVAVRDTHTDAHFVDFFESRVIEAPVEMRGELKKQINMGIAKFVRVDEKLSFSVLRELEDFAYYPEGITYILHQAEQPYLFCLIGEKVPKTVVRQAGKVISAFQRKYYGRGKPGRPPKLERWRKVIASEGQPGQIKDKAFLLWEDKAGQDLRVKQVYMSRVRSKLK